LGALLLNRVLSEPAGTVRFVREHLAAWLPNVHLALGDIGVVRDGIFEPVTSLKRLGIPFAVEPGGSGVELSYASTDKVTTTTKAGAKTGPAAAKGKVAVEFRAENAVLARCLESPICLAIR
jgi:hypothetical protein